MSSCRVLIALAAAVFVARTAQAGPTIDRAEMQPFGGYNQDYDPHGTADYADLLILGTEAVYYLNNGTYWESGAGSSYSVYADVDSVETVGGVIRYTLDLPVGARLFERTDYDSGDHSAQGKLVSTAPLILEATRGAQTASINGFALLVSNEMTWYGEPRFNFFSAEVGQLVPFTARYTLLDETWSPQTFDSAFLYNVAGTLDFAHAVPEPGSLALLAPCLLLLRRRTNRRTHHCGFHPEPPPPPGPHRRPLRNRISY